MEPSEMQFLVAEDHDFQRRNLVRMLDQLGAKRILEAADGRGALDYFSDLTQPLDVIICDLDMPGMDGMELIRHIGKSGAPASIILTSALDHTLIASVSMMAKAYGINVLGVIEKPATPAKLLNLIRQHGTVTTLDARVPRDAMDFGVSEMREALHEGQVVPCFQPQVDFSRGTLAGVEVRARWRHPALGLLAPAQFMEAFAITGLLEELTRVIIEHTAQAVRGWAQQGLDVTASIALPPSMLENPHPAAEIAAWIAPSDIAPRSITLEITDPWSTSHATGVLENLVRLRVKDFGIAIEDNDHTTCSVQFLNRFPFTCLKINRNVISDPVRQERLRQMLEARFEMSARLDFKTVACQIETRDEWLRLSRLGCNLGQGNFIAPAMDAAAIPEWAKYWKAPA